MNFFTFNMFLFSPEYGGSVIIYVTAKFEIDKLVAVVMSRHGNIESNQIHCSFHISCKFNVTIKESMMPGAKVLIYFVKDKHTMYQGETVIISGELGKNTVSTILFYFRIS